MKVRKKYFLIGFAILILIGVNVAIGFIFGYEMALKPWQFISEQILGMQWLNTLLGSLIKQVSGTYQPDTWQSIIQNAVQFFIYDLIKITILLLVLIFLISYIQSYFPPERTREILGRYHGIKANIIGALLGTVTPFCSCSSIPIFIGFTRAGLPSGVTFSFLISSPLVDLASLLLLVSFFGYPIAIAYVVVGLILAVVGGTLIEKTGLGDYVANFVKEGTTNTSNVVKLNKRERLNYAKEQMLGTYKKVFPYILMGILLGAIIHNVIPATFIAKVLGNNSWYGVILATLIGTPMYADIFGTLPVAEALYLKGAGLGSILAFMMSVTALSLPSLIMLKKVVKPKLLLAFIIIVVVGIILIGYGFNLLEYFWL